MLPMILHRGNSLGAELGRPTNRLDLFFDRVLGDMDRAFEGLGSTAGRVPMTLWEDDDHVYVEAEVPGVKQEDLDLTIDEGVLFLRGEHRPVEGRKVLYDGRTYGKFERAIRLPETVDPEKVEAGLTDGVLCVTFTKAPASKPRKVSIAGTTG